MTDQAALQIEEHRPHLERLAYRMLGEVAEAEDVVQDAYIRWQDLDHEPIDNPRAYLSTVVTRLCLDRFREVRRHRESYVGVWLPEPLVDEQPSATAALELADDVSFALMLTLERLSPLERAAFLLRDVFDLSFAEVAIALHRNETSCRQLASRARARVRQSASRFQISQEDGRKLSEAFFEASRSGDPEQLKHLLTEDANFHSDGGGFKLAALRRIAGSDKICRLFAGLFRKSDASRAIWHRHVPINGLPGFVSVEADGTLQTTALEFCGDRISEIYVSRNPHKLTHLLPLLPAEVRRQVR